MKFIVTNKKDIASSVAIFKKKISALSETPEKREWTFPNGTKDIFLTYAITTNLGELSVAIPKRTESGQNHYFALGDKLTPAVEVNIPMGLNRKVSGAYVKHGKQILICHRGRFTAYRGPIRKEISFAYFEKWLVTVEDNDKQSSLITITSLESSSLANDIAEFVSAVSDMKAQIKDGVHITQAEVHSKYGWRDSYEYEGIKSAGKSTVPKDYEYLHGPLCNALYRNLKELIASHVGFDVHNNANIDVAIVNKKSKKAVAIFEVKTSASLSGQLYSAHGQLNYYKYKCGEDGTNLILVLPEETKKQMINLDFFRSEGIDLLYGLNEEFTSSDGKSLSEIVKMCIRK